jgi:twitching motility protein PilT
LLDAIVRLEGDALVMHVGEKPYVVTASSSMNAYRGPLAWGQVELSSRVLTFDAVSSMLGQILPADQQQALTEFGAIEHEIPSPAGIADKFTVVAARGGEDVWVELRRRPVEAARAAAAELPAPALAREAAPAAEATPGEASHVAPAPVEAHAPVAEPPAAIEEPQAAPAPAEEPHAAPPAAAAAAEIEIEGIEIVQELEDVGEPAADIELDSTRSIVVAIPGQDAEEIALNEVPDNAIQIVDEEPQGVPTEEEVDAMLAATAGVILTSGLGEVVEEEAEEAVEIGAVELRDDAGDEDEIVLEVEMTESVSIIAIAAEPPAAAQEAQTAEPPLAVEQPQAAQEHAPEGVAATEAPAVHEVPVAQEVEAAPEGAPVVEEPPVAVPEPVAVEPALAQETTIEAPAAEPAFELSPPPLEAGVAEPEPEVVFEPPAGTPLFSPEAELAAVAGVAPGSDQGQTQVVSEEPQQEPIVEFHAPIEPPSDFVPAPAVELTPEAMPAPAADSVVAQEPSLDVPEPPAAVLMEPEPPAWQPPQPEVWAPQLPAHDEFAVAESPAIAEAPVAVDAVPSFEPPVIEPVAQAEPAVPTEAPAFAEAPILAEPPALVEAPVHWEPPVWVEPVTNLVETPASTESVDAYVASAIANQPPSVEEPAAMAVAIENLNTITQSAEPALSEPTPPIEAPSVPETTMEVTPELRPHETPIAPMADMASEAAASIQAPPPTACEPEAPAAMAAASAEPDSEARHGVVVPLTRTPVKPEVAAPYTPSEDAALMHTLRAAAARGASTVYVVAQSKPMIRIDGEIGPLENEPTLTAADVDRLVMELAPPRRREALQNGPVEWLCDVPEVGRVRCLTFRDHRGPGVLFRMMPPRAISVDQLGLTAEVQALCQQSDGLVLVAGARSSGKSTLLNSFIDVINRTRSDHLITVESQIGFLHESRRSFVSQRETRGDADLAATCVRAALREDPDVIVVEDLRSAELVTAALEAAESGRLVLASIGAASTIGALERLIELVPSDRRARARSTLATSLRGVIAQVLLRRNTGGRVAAREILLNTPAVSQIVLEGKMFQLPVALDSGRRHGMVPLTDSLAAHVRAGTVDVAEAYRKALDRAALVALLKREGFDTSFAERLA